MIGFLVPVKSKQLSSDWEFFSELVSRSLNSINGQKDRNFQIVVACHELPNNPVQNEQVHYVQVDFDPPNLTRTDREKDRQLKEGDKARKILSAYEYATKNFDIDYFMVVDSDDCIHNGISSYVNGRIDNQIPGWYFQKGYYYREGKKLAFLNKHTFNNLCGSCIIIRADLFKNLIVEEPFLYYYHEQTQLSNGISLKPFPMAGAIYSMANGENHHMSTQVMHELVNRPKYFSRNYINSLIGKLMKYRPRYIGKRFKSTYNFYTIS